METHRHDPRLTKTGNYLHSPSWKCRKEFLNGRAFIIMIAAAYVAAGWKKYNRKRNGVVVIDCQTEEVLFDEHLPFNSPEQAMCYFDLAETVEYDEFIEKVKSNPNYRGELL